MLQLDGDVCALDDVSTRLLDAILQCGPQAAAATFAQRCGIDADIATRDTLEFLAELKRKRILRRHGSPGTFSRRLRGMAAQATLGTILMLIDRLTVERHRVRWFLFAARWAVAQFRWASAVEAWSRWCQDVSRRRPAMGHVVLLDSVLRDVADSSLLNPECKERALASLAIACSAGHSARLVLGLSMVPLAGHVWVECDNHILSDCIERCLAFEPVAVYPRAALASMS